MRDLRASAPPENVTPQLEQKKRFHRQPSGQSAGEVAFAALPLLTELHRGVDRRERGLHIRPHGLKLCEQTIERRRPAFIALSRICLKGLPKPDRAHLRIATSPVRVH